jgi:1-acyl-sn-glycerol-3-phosphate acyltransferase
MIRFMEAREFYDKKPLTYIYRALRVIPVNRTGNDTVSVRTAVRELTNNGCIGIFPEGRISDDGQLQEARQGVALLALLSGAPVVPAFIKGTGGYSGMIRDFFRLSRVTLFFGPAIRFDDLRDRHRDKEAREIALKRIMDALADLAAVAARAPGRTAKPNREPLPEKWGTSG